MPSLALAAFGVGNGLHAFEVASDLNSWGIPRIATDVALAALAFPVIVGGVKRIAQVASALVPFMLVAYVVACLLVLLANATAVPGALGAIFANAFTGKAAATGTLAQVILMGFKRGIFSNEAGLWAPPPLPTQPPKPRNQCARAPPPCWAPLSTPS